MRSNLTLAALITLSSIDVVLARHHLSRQESGDYALAALFGRLVFWGTQFVALSIVPAVGEGAGRRTLHRAGLLVLEGLIRKGLNARLTREDVIVSATTIASLRRFKDDVAEVRVGLECGVVLSDTNDIKPGDMLEVFEVEERARHL